MKILFQTEPFSLIFDYLNASILLHQQMTGAVPYCNNTPQIDLPITIGSYPIRDTAPQQNGNYAFHVERTRNVPPTPITRQPEAAPIIPLPSAPESQDEPLLHENESNVLSTPVPPYPTAPYPEDGWFIFQKIIENYNFSLCFVYFFFVHRSTDLRTGHPRDKYCW